jgi:hypothetical protein
MVVPSVGGSFPALLLQAAEDPLVVTRTPGRIPDTVLALPRPECREEPILTLFPERQRRSRVEQDPGRNGCSGLNFARDRL